jgi:methionyl-tRNA synthetase
MSDSPAEEAKKLSKAEKIALEDKDLSLDQRCTKRVELRVAKITKVEQHPEADKLYIETLDDGSGEDRTIVSGLVPYYSVEQLTGKHIILVANLKAAKLRGVKSHGMLLAASRKDGDEEVVSVIEAPWAQPGTRILVEDPSETTDRGEGGETTQIDIDTFFDIPLKAEGGLVMVGTKNLIADGRVLESPVVPDGSIG